MRQAVNGLGIKGSVLVINNGKTLLDYATDNTADTSYLINSVQKSMTAAMVMREIQDGKLSMDDRLAKFYPTVPGAKKVKIKDLLKMTSGLSLEPGKKLGTKHFVSDEDNIKHDIKKTVFDSDMVGKWNYSSLNYVYLCGIISQLENKSYEQLFKSTFVKPLKLKHTAFLWSSPGKLVASGLVPGHDFKHGRYTTVKYRSSVREAHNELGAGSVVMSNHDLAKVLQYILAGSLLTKESRKILYKAGPPSYYNGGLYNKARYKTANGAGQGYFTFMRSTKDARDMIIIQNNHSDGKKFIPTKVKIDKIMSKLISMK